MNYYRQRTMLMFKVWTDGMRNELMDDELSEWTLRPNRFRPPTPPVTDYIASSVVFVSFSHNNTCIEFAQHTGGLLFCLRHQPPATLFQLPHPVLYVVYYTVLYDTSSSVLSVMLMYAFNIKPWSSHLSSNSVRQLVVWIGTTNQLASQSARPAKLLQWNTITTTTTVNRPCHFSFLLSLCTMYSQDQL